MQEGNIFLVAGLGFGDEGKGSVTDYLARKYGAKTIVRYNGGPQTAHNVVSGEFHHCFSQFGSGMLIPGVNTFLSRFMLIDPLSLMREGEVLKEKHINDVFHRITIDRDCIIVTPFHGIINKMLEIALGKDRHGSCGRGVGAAMKDWQALGSDVLLAGDLANESTVKSKLSILLQRKIDLAHELVFTNKKNNELQRYLEQLTEQNYVERLIDAYRNFLNSGVRFGGNETLREIIAGGENVVFEGAQGVMLDPEFGFWPHVTKTRTTFKNAEKLLRESEYEGRVIKIGVLRAYHTRHGVGPFMTEDAKLGDIIPDRHNGTHEWQGNFRVGWFDAVAARYALRAIGGVDCLALTNADRLYNPRLDSLKVCMWYKFASGGEEGLVDEERFLPVEPTLRQTCLTKFIQKCRPVYHELNLRAFADRTDLMEAYLKLLERSLGMPVSLISFGPSAREKKEIHPFV